MNSEAFLAYVEKMLASALCPGDTVIIDNLSAHKIEGVRPTIEATGATVLYLPPYPIEMFFVKLKALLREAAERTREALWNRIDLLIDAFTRRNAPITSLMRGVRHAERGML